MAENSSPSVSDQDSNLQSPLGSPIRSPSPIASPSPARSRSRSPYNYDRDEYESDHEQGPALLNRILTKKKQSGKRNRRSANEQDEIEETLVDNLINKMNRAAEEDIELHRNHKPAIQKLKLLDRAVKFLTVGKYHDMFLQMNGCIVLGEWLKQLPDGSFPCTPIKEKLLTIIENLPITTENLQSSTLGRSILAIAQCKSENMRIRRQAQALVEKWSRMIYQIDNEYSALEEYEKHSNRIASIPMPRRRQQNDTGSNYTRIPDRGLFDFRFRPVSKIQNEGRNIEEVESESTQRLRKKIRAKKTGGRKLFSSMSVDGRGLAN